ncbi:MAG: PP2C family protein-serine/threonine phosphatase [Lachnospiraceae bacterium]|nr:PP2C family protein-serine/threonine phosphatase [Lachnospiraceae bacterium]
MPAKSVREMNKYELMHYSLAGKTFHMVFMIAVVFAVLSLLISTGLYMSEMVKQIASDDVMMARNAATVIDQSFDVEEMCSRVLEVYKSIPEDVRQNPDSSEYRSYYKKLEADTRYRMLELVLKEFKDSGMVNDIYLTTYDEENGKLIYVVDPDRTETRNDMGDYDDFNVKYIEKLRKSTIDKPFRTFFSNNGVYMISGSPTSDDEGCNSAILVDTSIQHIILKSRQFVLFYVIFITVITIILGYFATSKVKKTLVRPLNELAVAANEYVYNKRKGKDTGNHFKDLKIDTGDEIEILYLMMTDMEKDINDYEKNLQSITAERERIGAEIEIATTIQQSMLENVAPDFVGKKEYDLYAAMSPAREVGGDFYDFFMVDDDHLAILIADVSDKGVGSAFFMAISKTLVKTYAKMVGNPSEVIAKVDKQISEKNDAGLFVTVWIAIIDLNTGHVTACNAGHDYPAIMKDGEDFVIEKTPHGPPVAFIPGMDFVGTEFDLKPGDRIFLYTDGLNEAKRGDGERFGTDRMLEVLNAHKDADNEEMIHIMRKAVDEFAGDEPQFDDMTMLGFTFKGREG